MKLDYYNLYIYPLRIYVAIVSDLNEIKTKFRIADSKPFNFSFDKNDAAATIKNIIDEENKHCILVAFKPKEHTIKCVAHEVCHIVDFIWDFLGEVEIGAESNAYLTGYITDCIYKTIAKSKTK